ncbi:MAG TPA: enoyl-ACP reductase [Candidatus Polarisedimenticolia bacterium]|nr:enoyl-ACP reductase [Candidatus Polarisedimenticolia bacterium]
MFTLDLSGKTGIVFGVANHRSLAWSIAQQLHGAGARLAFSYAGERLREKVEDLASTLEGSLVMDCDVTSDEAIARVFRQTGERFGKLDFLVHSVAFANKEDLEGAFLDTSRSGFHLAMDISAYSLVRLAKEAAPLMEKGGGGIVTLTYMASQRVVPSYNVMGSAKAALEHEVRQLAYELGPRNIRVNAISAGPVNTLSARGISGFMDMLHVARQKAPLRRGIEPAEVGKAALFLLSDMGSGITGETLYVDAGYNIMGI